jgi:hypothetical protein
MRYWYFGDKIHKALTWGKGDIQFQRLFSCGKSMSVIFDLELLKCSIDFAVFFGDLLQVTGNACYSGLAHGGILAFSKVRRVQQPRVVTLPRLYFLMCVLCNT